MNTSDLLASLALAVSIIGSIFAYQGEKRARKNEKEQDKIKEEQDRIRVLMLKKEERTEINELKADLNARFSSAGINKKVLKIYNTGNHSAKNVNIKFPNSDQHEYLILEEIDALFPYEILHKNNSIDLISYRTLSIDSKKFRIILSWEDGFSRFNEKEIYL
ncbi:hypothetical protein ACK1M2_000002 [Providencia rettgeri]